MRVLYAHRYVSPRRRTLTEHEKKVRHVSYALKNPKDNQAETYDAAWHMSQLLLADRAEADIILVPVPTSAGSLEPNRLLIKYIIEFLITSKEIEPAQIHQVDLVYRTGPVESSCERRKKGLWGLSPEQHNICRDSAKKIPIWRGSGKLFSAHPRLYFVDNIRGGGNTLQACFNAVGFGTGVVYADADLYEGTLHQDLGTANGWDKDDPAHQILKSCGDRGHHRWCRNIGRCYNEYGCDSCGYTYKVDSSD